MVDHDQLFKKLISTFFWEFIELFLPQVLDYLDSDSLTFLPEEIFTDIPSGERRKIDLLAQVKFQEQPTCFLIHIESQSYTQPEFERRMFHYFARLDEKYRLPIYPVVIFSFDRPLRAEPSRYHVTFPDRQVLEFSYVAIQLNRLNWRQYLQHPNPVAAALMAKMKFKPEERAKVKLECLRMLVTLRLDPARTQLISGFVDTYLRLDAAEEKVFNTELEKLGLTEEEQVMEIVTSWMERGIEQGIQQGIQQGEASLVLRQLNRRFGEMTSRTCEQIRGLEVQQLEELAEALLDFESQADLSNWLIRHSN